MEMLDFIKKLELFSPRSGSNERLACEFLEKELKKLGIDYVLQDFKNFLPSYKGFGLKIDGEKIESMPTSFKSGSITEKNLISSMAVSGRYYEEPNINFNPYSDSFSLATFYRAPSLAIKRKDVQKVIDANDIDGYVEVEKAPHECSNIIAGNAANPKNIFICHYDTVLHGALDNASGTAILMELVKKGRNAADMFVFAGCEELSFDSPVYWGKGYRVLEEGYGDVLDKANKLVAVDMIGSGEAGLIKDGKTRLAAFPIQNKELFDKAYIVSVTGNEWLGAYHSHEDRPDLLNSRFLTQGLELIEKISK